MSMVLNPKGELLSNSNYTKIWEFLKTGGPRDARDI